MSDASLTPEVLRRAAAEVASTRDDNGAFDLVAKVITEALLDQATHRTVAVSPSVLDAKLSDAKLSLDTVAVPSGKPLEILRGGARNPTERALVACLFARHLGTTLDRRDGLHSLRELLPSLDWLEFVGQYPPYTAARATLADDPRGRLDDLLRAAPITAPTDATRDAVRALRGIAPPAVTPNSSTALDRAAPTDGGHEPRAKTRRDRDINVSVACEVEGFERGALSRLVFTVLPLGAIATALRVVFVHRRPATLTLDNQSLRVVGHSEILGRTLSTWDARYPLSDLVELRRESRYPSLPAALSVFALAIGSIFGAKFVVEGARAVYFPLIALGLGLLAGGIFFDWVLRAVFPGVRARTRLTVRAGTNRGVVLTELPVDELDKLLDTLDSLSSQESSQRPPLITGPEALTAATVRDVSPAPERHPPARH